jgi:predicted peptidase
MTPTTRLSGSAFAQVTDNSQMFCAPRPAPCALILDRPGYVVHLPRDYDPSRAWPVILFLHGAGERGTDPHRATQIGVASAIRQDPALVPAIVVFPIAPEESRWLDAPADAAMLALDRTLDEFHCDRDRVYVTGLSMGGYGAIHLALAHPGRFAAMVVVCGGLLPHPTTTAVQQSPLTMEDRTGGRPRPPSAGESTRRSSQRGADEGVRPSNFDSYQFAARSLKGIPIWLFHGADDPVIPVDESRRLHEQLLLAGARVHYTEYPNVGHNAWEKAYADRAMWTWLFAQQRS